VHGVHHALQGRIEEGLAGFGIEVTDQLGIPFEVGKQHGDLLALALQGTAGRENFLGEIGGGVGERRPSGCPCSRCGGWRRGARVTGPHEDAVVLIHRQALTVNQLILEGLQVLVIQLEV